MTTATIPVQAYIIAVDDIPSSWTESEVRNACRTANEIWYNSGISFVLKNITTVEETPPPGSVAGAIDDNQFFYLISRYPGRHFLSALFVNKFSGEEGGNSTFEDSAPWNVGVGFNFTQHERGRILAHEMGHVLHLDHPDKGERASQEEKNRLRTNLMFSSMRMGMELTANQIRAALNSALAKRFGG